MIYANIYSWITQKQIFSKKDRGERVTSVEFLHYLEQFTDFPPGSYLIGHAAFSRRLHIRHLGFFFLLASSLMHGESLIHYRRAEEFLMRMRQCPVYIKYPASVVEATPFIITTRAHSSSSPILFHKG